MIVVSPRFLSRFAFTLAAALALGGFASIAFDQDQDAASRPVASAKAADLGFLAGGWRMKRGASETEEHWLPPKGGALLGVNRTVAGDRMTEFEFLRIVETKSGIDYVAQPNGREPTRFKLTKIGANEAVFENPEHDFPTKIAYAKDAEGRLHATVSGKGRGGKDAALVFTFEPIK